jgi:hypothetical protein
LLTIGSTRQSAWMLSARRPAATISHAARKVRIATGVHNVYELLYDGDGAAGIHLSGLLDVARLRARGYDSERSGSAEPRSASGRPSVGGLSGTGRRPPIAAMPQASTTSGEDAADMPETPALRNGAAVLSYPLAASA